MDVKTVLSFIAAFISLQVSLCGGDADHPLYLLDLYDCIDDYEDYCHNIPEFTIRAAIELANNRKDILPGYILHTSNVTSFPVGSIKSGEVMFIVQSFSLHVCCIPGLYLSHFVLFSSCHTSVHCHTDKCF